MAENSGRVGVLEGPCLVLRMMRLTTKRRRWRFSHSLHFHSPEFKNRPNTTGFVSLLAILLISCVTSPPLRFMRTPIKPLFPLQQTAPQGPPPSLFITAASTKSPPSLSLVLPQWVPPWWLCDPSV